MTTAKTGATDTILAIDLGKFNNVACHCRRSTIRASSSSLPAGWG
jgi:hypothetical protein